LKAALRTGDLISFFGSAKENGRVLSHAAGKEGYWTGVF
jgi:hypothetical protein